MRLLREAVPLVRHHHGRGDGIPHGERHVRARGQCGTVCPVGARTLHLKEEVLELPETLLDDYNAKGMYRFANDMIA